MQTLFAWDFNRQKSPPVRIKEMVNKLKMVDDLIQRSAPSRPLEQINKLDLAILRLAVYELTSQKDTPPKVVIDEAIELGKQYGSDSSGAFINGALGKVLEIIQNE